MKINVEETREKYQREEEFKKYYDIIQPRLVDIQAWHDDGYNLTFIEKRLGLGENELWYMVYYLKIKELKKIFVSEKTQLARLEKTLYKLANGYYAVTYDKANHPVFKFIPPDMRALEFLLSNKMPNKYQKNGQEPSGDSEEKEKEYMKVLEAMKTIAKN